MPTRAVRKALAVIVGGLVTLITVVGVSLYLLAGSLCGNELLAESASPDGRFKAIVFQRDCGATTGFSTQVSVVKASASTGNSAGNVFIADTSNGAPSGPGGDPMVKVQWRSPELLVVSHHAAARVFTAESKIGSVNVHYEHLPQ
jgi:hypothetical protein